MTEDEREQLLRLLADATRCLLTELDVILYEGIPPDEETRRKRRAALQVHRLAITYALRQGPERPE